MADKLGMQLEITFEPYDSVNRKLDSLLKRLQKANKLDIEVDTRTFDKLEAQFNKLKEKIDKGFKMDVSTETANSVIRDIETGLNKLDKKQVKIIDGKEVQVIEQVKKNLLETEKIIKNLETGSKTNLLNFDYSKTQGDLYKQLNSLQKDEFNIKQSLIGQDGEIKVQLEQQLGLIKQQQTEVAKLITSYKLQGEDNVNQYLAQRQKLMSDLTIAQEKYNIKTKEEGGDIQTKIRQYQDKMGTEIQKLQTKYKDLVPKKQLEEFQLSLNKLNATSMKGLQNEFKDLDNQFKKLTADTKAKGINVANQDARGLSSLLSKDIVAFASWKVIGDAIMLAYRSIGDSVKFVYDMDTAMVNLKKITDETTDTYRKFAIESNNIAKNLASGTTQVVDATVAWKKAGYSLSEAKELSKTTVIGANVGDVDVNSIQKFLVAPLKAWNIEGSKSIKILDIMNNVSNQHAVTIQDLGESYSRASSVMAMANNTLEETTALVTAAQAKTQMGGDTIGNGLRTIALRLTQMKDEEGNIIPKLAEDFELVGVHLKDANGGLNSTYNIIKQLSSVWGTLDPDRQLNLLEKAAGKQRANILAAMITNFQEAEKTLKDSLNSTNSAMNEQNAYMQSLEAKTKVFKETLNGVYQKAISSDSLKNVVDLGTSMINTLGNAVDKFGAINIAIVTATTSLFAFNKNLKMITLTPTINESGFMTVKVGMFDKIINSLKKSMGEFGKSYNKLLNEQMLNNNIMQPTILTKMSVGMKALTTTTIAQTVAVGALKVAQLALNAAVGMGIGLVISLAVEGLSKLINKSKEAKQTQEELLSTIRDSSADLQSKEQLISKYDELSKKENQNADTKKELLELQRQLASAFPELIDGVDEEGNKIVKSTDAVKARIKEEKELLRLKMLSLGTQAKSELPTLQEDASKTKGRIDEIVNKLKTGDTKQTTTRNSHGESFEYEVDNAQKLRDELNGLISHYSEVQGKVRDYNNVIQENDKLTKESIKDEVMNNIVKAQSAEQAQATEEKLKKQGATQEMINQVIEENTKVQQENNNASTNSQAKFKSMDDIQKELAKSMSDARSGIEDVNKVLEHHASVGEWDLETIIKISEQYPQLLGLLGNDKALEQELIKIKGDKVKATQDSLNNQLKLEVDYLNSMTDGYNFDISNFASANEAKTQMLKSSVNKRIALYERELNAAMSAFDAAQSIEAKNNALRGAMLAGDNLSIARADVDYHIDRAYMLQKLSASVGNYMGKIGSQNYDGKKNPVDKSAEDAAKKAEEARKQMESDVKDVESAITEIIKKEFEKRKQAIEDEYNKRKEALQKEKDLYNKANSEDDYTKNLRKEQDTLNKINASIVNARRDTSRAGQMRLDELLEQQRQQQEKIDEMVLSHTRDTNNQLFDEKLAQLDKEKEAQDKALSEQYSDENISKMVNSAMITGQISGIGSVLDAYLNFQNKYNQGLTASGKLIETEFISKWEKVRQLINGTSGINIGVNFGSLPSYAVGTPLLPNDQVLQAHQNEAIIPAEINPFRGGKYLNNFMNMFIPNKLPNVLSNKNKGNVNFNEPFVVIQGNVDKDVDLEGIVDRATAKFERKMMQIYNDEGVFTHP